MIWFLILFIIVDIIQVLYIKHLKKEIAFRDGEEVFNTVYYCRYYSGALHKAFEKRDCFQGRRRSQRR